MKQETIEKAVKVINRSIKHYQKKLTYQLELRAEARFNNGNLEVNSLGDYESNIQRYEIILADLATIKRAIKNNQTNAKIYGTKNCDGFMYIETSDTLKKARLDFDGDGFEKIFLESIDERKEEQKEEEGYWDEREEEWMAMQYNGLMAEFEE